MNKKYLILFLILIILIFTNSVKAAGNPSCKYKNINDESQLITTIIDIDNSLSTYSFDLNIDGNKLNVMYANNHECGNNQECITLSTFFGYFDNYDNAVDFYNTEKRCPDYFYINKYLDGNYKAGFSNKISSKLLQKPSYSFKAVEEEVEEDPNGQLVSKVDRYSCTLGIPEHKFVIDINYTEKDIVFSNNEMPEEALKYYKKNFNYEKKEGEQGKCPEDLKVCYQDYFSQSDRTYTIIYDGYTNIDSSLTCDQASFDSSNNPSNSSCQVFLDFVNEYKDNLTTNYSKASNAFETLKSFCLTVSGNHNYSNDENSCIYMCLHLSDYISNSNFEKSECGISSKLLIWILNIVKWVKYIIPVIVILMGILDFMRAVASDKDDAMKKAQGRFVKRLIAAALIFVVPFILEFILEKMGFSIKGCNITDILK